MIGRNGVFEQWLRTGHFGSFLVAGDNSGIGCELKFNPYHDPRDGRFATSANAGVSARTRPVAGRVFTRDGRQGGNTLPSRGMVFLAHAARTGQAGDVARAANRLISDRKARVSMKLGGDEFRVVRTGEGSVRLSMGPLGLITLDGSFRVVDGKQGIRIDIMPPRIPGARVRSFPRRIDLFESRDGKLVYRMDQDIDVAVPLLGRTIRRKRGAYIIPDSGE